LRFYILTKLQCIYMCVAHLNKLNIAIFMLPTCQSVKVRDVLNVNLPIDNESNYDIRDDNYA